MNPREKCCKLIAFLLQKVSIDHFGRCVVLEAGKKRKTLSWIGFYIIDEELPQIVERVMTAYDRS